MLCKHWLQSLVQDTRQSPLVVPTPSLKARPRTVYMDYCVHRTVAISKTAASPTLDTWRGLFCSEPPCSRKPQGAPPERVTMTSSSSAPMTSAPSLLSADKSLLFPTVLPRLRDSGFRLHFCKRCPPSHVPAKALTFLSSLLLKHRRVLSSEARTCQPSGSAADELTITRRFDSTFGKRPESVCTCTLSISPSVPPPPPHS